MDILSEILKVVKLEGSLFFNGEFSAPWCLSSRRSKEIAHYLSATARHVIIYHFLTEGRAYAKLADGTREDLTAGDIVIFPHGDAHFLGNGWPEKPVDSFNTFAKNLMEGLRLAQFGGGGETTRFVCGFLACDPRLSEVVLAGLPPILKIHIRGAPSGEWIENTIRFSVGDATDSNDGAALVHAKLSEVLFVETLRRYINSLPPDQIGWLAGARDPIAGQALALLHKRPAHSWTIAELARAAGSSRTRLAERFRHFLNQSPIAYLGQWRLELAARMLESTSNSVAQIATEVGYGSEASFNRAFKRKYSCPPAQFRRRQQQAGESM
jgi:AraC-like DNA-binding protein